MFGQHWMILAVNYEGALSLSVIEPYSAMVIDCKLFLFAGVAPAREHYCSELQIAV
jgi:hypothetical protein